jgi:hypothetical protein
MQTKQDEAEKARQEAEKSKLEALAEVERASKKIAALEEAHFEAEKAYNRLSAMEEE